MVEEDEMEQTQLMRHMAILSVFGLIATTSEFVLPSLLCKDWGGEDSFGGSCSIAALHIESNFWKEKKEEFHNSPWENA